VLAWIESKQAFHFHEADFGTSGYMCKFAGMQEWREGRHFDLSAAMTAKGQLILDAGD